MLLFYVKENTCTFVALKNGRVFLLVDLPMGLQMQEEQNGVTLCDFKT